jgi:predicted ABC-type ATPase
MTANPPTGRTRQVVIIAGPNGAGKSTFARQYLPNEAGCPIFVNADLIAVGLSPFDPAAAALRAGRLMLDEIHRHARSGRSFAFETTLAGRGYTRLISAWQVAGYWVHLTFLKLHDADLAVERVATRVAQGGHDVPEPVIRRRFEKGWANFQNLYRELVDSWRLYDNSGEESVLLEESRYHE